HLATTEICTSSLHDALPISPALPAAGSASRLGGRARRLALRSDRAVPAAGDAGAGPDAAGRNRLDGRRRVPEPQRLDPRRDGLRDRKSTRLNSSHVKISYAV